MAAVGSIPKSCRKLVVQSLGTRFRDAVKPQTIATPRPDKGEVLVRMRYAGINASDINWTAGRYTPGVEPPFDAGMEGMGHVVAVGDECRDMRKGDAVMFMHMGAFSDYMTVPYSRALKLPCADPGYLPLLLSGCTASISLEKVGEMRSGEKVLVTAAAGGTGQFAVQLAKLAGCHVIGTCSTDEKTQLLRRLGCDRPINYKKEDLKQVLRSEYPEGVDVVYESVGGETFNTSVKCLAMHGRLIVIGFIGSYQDSFTARPTLPLHQILLSKSASVRGFFLNHFLRDIPTHFGKLARLYKDGGLQSKVDLGESAPRGPFKGLDGVYDAVDYLYSGKSRGKVVVEIGEEEEEEVTSTAKL